jgi:hypothetical protein
MLPLAGGLVKNSSYMSFRGAAGGPERSEGGISPCHLFQSEIPRCAGNDTRFFSNAPELVADKGGVLRRGMISGYVGR